MSIMMMMMSMMMMMICPLQSFCMGIQEIVIVFDPVGLTMMMMMVVMVMVRLDEDEGGD